MRFQEIYALNILTINLLFLWKYLLKSRSFSLALPQKSFYCFSLLLKILYDSSYYIYSYTVKQISQPIF